ncbi:8823_t:CDS:10 [Ambispora leptoticha]|uniref:DNA ligase (NAD(+)) n=1 Tax=Ambispora leptoticha TaxID=144679 RepID=A0A9N9GLD4_9GLOM|nr:8823_t:CDS:10 [Ambispora leptoticha]
MSGEGEYLGIREVVPTALTNNNRGSNCSKCLKWADSLVDPDTAKVIKKKKDEMMETIETDLYSDRNKKGGLSGGLITLIVIGVVAIIGLVSFFLLRKVIPAGEELKEQDKGYSYFSLYEGTGGERKRRNMKSQPSIEDAVYDKHLKELRELEIQYNLVLPDSPTQKAGHPVSPKFRSVVRQIPMLSLDSVDNYESLLKFDERVKKILKTEEAIEYAFQVSTRGNGVIGEDITFNKELIKNIPFALKEVANCEVRGEVYMKKEEFYRLNEELKKSGNKLLANPRNAASGSLRTLIPLQGRNLHFFAYQLFNNDLPTQLTCLQELEKLGFSVSPDYQLFMSIEKVGKFIQKQEKNREKLDFESDAIAYKFPASVASSSIRDIYTEVSRNGRITYVAEIIPLNIGDEVVIKKAGDVIPQIVQVVNYLTHFASKNGLDIKGVSQKIIQKLYENNLLNRPTDFYQLYQKEKELLKLEGCKKKSVNNILNSIEESKKKSFPCLLTALGIPLFSSVKSQKLANFYPTLTSLLAAIEDEE